MWKIAQEKISTPIEITILQHTTVDSLIWDRYNLFEGRSPIMFRGRHEKEMYYFFQVLFKVFFIIYYLAGVISLWLCNWRLKVCLFAKKKSYKIYRSYIDRNILYYNKNKTQIQMSVLFPNIFETKQYFFVLDFSVLHLW
jgi:hypothetical protein